MFADITQVGLSQQPRWVVGELSELITTLGVPLGVIIWIAIGVISLINKQAPAVIERYQERKTDREEHSQSLENQKLKHELRRDELLALTEAGNRTFTEEQLTVHLSEIYDEFNTVNAFVRDVVEGRLRNVEQAVSDIAAIKEKLAEVKMFVRAIYSRLEDLDETVAENDKGNDVTEDNIEN